MVSHVDLIARIAVGAVLGGVIGFERNRHGRPIGFRTHLIVAMASATFMVISAHFQYYQGYENETGVHTAIDASRIAASVVSAIGFLAGGAILRTGNTVQGLTTAAGLWLVTAIGLCAGAGMYIESIAVTLMGLFALTLLKHFKDRPIFSQREKEEKTSKRKLTLIVTDGPHRLTEIVQFLNALGARVAHFEYEKKFDLKEIKMTFDLRLPTTLSVEHLIAELEQRDGIREMHIKSI